MHFSTGLWKCNIAEIMGSKQTSEDVYDQVIEFAREIKMVPVRINKEQSGYILNSLLIPFLQSAKELWVNGVADPQTIDKDWMISTGSSMAPFMMLDKIGLRTTLSIDQNIYKETGKEVYNKMIQKLEAMIKDGRDGKESGAGFYDYPHPKFEDPNFLK